MSIHKKFRSVILVVFVFTLLSLTFLTQTVSAGERPKTATRVEKFRVPEGDVVVTVKEFYDDRAIEAETIAFPSRIQSFLDVQSIFDGETLLATCNNGARLYYGVSSGSGYHIIYYGSSSYSNNVSCGGSYCTVDVQTSWSAYYTSAEISFPSSSSGNINFYLCR